MEKTLLPPNFFACMISIRLGLNPLSARASAYPAKALNRGLATRARSYALRHIASDGMVECLHASPRNLVESFQILPRDCRLLQTTVSHIQVRADYFIFRFPPFAGAVRHDRVMLIANDSEAAAEALQARLLAPGDEDETSGNGISVRSLPFEHRVLEALLREDTLQKWDRYMRLNQLIKATRATTGPSFQGEGESWTAWLGASWLLNTEREAAVYRLLTLSNLLTELSLDVKSSSHALSTLLASDEDMAGTYLTFLAAEGTLREAHQHTEVELMLENFATEHEDLLDRIDTLSDSIKTHRLLEQLRLSNERESDPGASYPKLALPLPVADLLAAILRWIDHRQPTPAPSMHVNRQPYHAPRATPFLRDNVACLLCYGRGLLWYELGLWRARGRGALLARNRSYRLRGRRDLWRARLLGKAIPRVAAAADCEDGVSRARADPLGRCIFRAQEAGSAHRRGGRRARRRWRRPLRAKR